MPSPTATLLATTLLLFAPSASAQRFYTVWSSVIFQRTGERTPEIIGDATIPIVLTSTGANQAQAAGQFFRNRYIGNETLPKNSTNGAGNSTARLAGLDGDIYDELQVYSTALDQQWNVATAQAWFQGFYPPFTPGSNGSADTQLDPEDVLADGNYVS